MDRQIAEITQQIEKAYQDMNKHAYHLHSICVHDGSALSGHYFTFIKDRYNKKWRKFNDIRVTDATEEEVF